MDINKILSLEDQRDIEALAAKSKRERKDRKTTSGFRILCSFGWHKWSSWKLVQYGPLVDNGKDVGSYEDYFRVCKKCGNPQNKRISW